MKLEENTEVKNTLLDFYITFYITLYNIEFIGKDRDYFHPRDDERPTNNPGRIPKVGLAPH